ncbi:hypothetical protein LV779_34935 [Streptomyces thinghirensis]|nr:hypothetical protein [Streptomyces thinghirensis]
MRPASERPRARGRRTSAGADPQTGSPNARPPAVATLVERTSPLHGHRRAAGRHRGRGGHSAPHQESSQRPAPATTNAHLGAARAFTTVGGRVTTLAAWRPGVPVVFPASGHPGHAGPEVRQPGSGPQPGGAEQNQADAGERLGVSTSSRLLHRRRPASPRFHQP